MRKKLIIKILKYLSLTLIILGFSFTHFVLPRMFIQKKSALKTFLKGDPVYEYDHLFNDSTKYKRKKLSTISFDNLELSSILTYSKSGFSKGTVILLPSSGSTKYDLLHVTEFLADNGLNSVAVDLRGFGESDGTYITYGVKEKKDVQNIIDYLVKKEHLDNIGIWGQSLGAAVAMQVMGTDKRIKFGIIESTFTDYRTSVDNYFSRIAKFDMKLFSTYIINRAGNIADFDVNDASPIKYAQNITQPILITHGKRDRLLDVKFAKKNYDKVKSIDKKLIILDSAAHNNVWKVGGDKYFKQVLDFLNQQNVK